MNTNFIIDDNFRETSLDLRQYIEIVRRRLWILIAVFITAAVVAVIQAQRQIPVYKAAATLIIEPEPVQANDAFGMYYSYKAFFFNTQCDILVSDKVVRKAVDMYGKDVSADAFKGSVTVEDVKETYLAKVSVTHTDPEEAAGRANALVRAFLEYTREDKRSASRDSYSWMSEQLAILKAKVQKSEMELLEFKENESIVSLEKRQTLIEENLSLTHKKFMEASLNVLELETKIDEIKKISKNPKLMETFPGIAENETIGVLKQEYAIYNLELSKLSKKYKPKHPKITAIKSQIANVRKRINAEIGNFTKGIEIEYRIAKTNEQAVKNNLEELKRESMTLSHQAVQYGVLKRDAESNEQMYAAMLGSLKRADITGSMTPNNIRIVDEAKIPKSPLGPDKKRRILMGLVIGLALGTGLAVLVEYLDDTIKNESDLLFHLKGELLGLVPKEKKHKNLPHDLPPKALLQSYRNIKTVLSFYRQEHVLKTMLVTSAIASEGKTACAMFLGKLFAESGLKVLLIDADFFRPRFRRIFRIESKVGLTDVLNGGNESESIFESGIPNLSVMPSGLLPANPSRLLESEKITAMLETLKEEFDLIVFDSPPLSAFVELTFLCSLVDGVAFIVKANSTSRHIIKKMLDLLKTSKSNILGFILSHVSRSHHDVTYYYKYYDSYYDKKEKADDTGNGK